MDSLILGQYIPGESFVHQLDSRTKLLASIWFIVLIFITSAWWTYGLLILLVLATVSMTKIPLSYYLKGLRPLVFLILLTVIFQLLFSQGDTVLFEFWIITITMEGLLSSVTIIIRFVLIVLMSTVLTLTTTPLEIADGIESILNPLKKIKLPVQEIALILSIALRFVPTLMQETEKIMNAQRARGMDFSSGSLIERMKKVVPLLIPLFISAIDRADQLAIAMTARGYRGGDHRTKLRKLTWGSRDLITLLIFIAITVTLIFTRFML